MLGRMQEWPLLMHKIIDFAAIQFPDREVASRMVEGPMHRTNYREIRDRAVKVAKRLDRDGIRLGDRVATLAWNGFRHLEAWYGITGIGAIYHTVNPRLFPEQIAWIINHAEDRIVMTDLTFVPLLEAIAGPSADGRALYRPDRRRPHAGDQAEERCRLRGLDRRGRHRLSVEGVRRAHRGRPLLHLGHDRQSERRALLASLEHPPFDDGDRSRNTDAERL